MNRELDIAASRKAKKYSGSETLRRLLWMPASWLFRLTPRPFFALRSMLLRLFGANIGRHVHIYASVRIFMPWNLEVADWASIGEEAYIYNVGSIRIAERSTISHRVHLCAGSHDYTDPALPLLKLPIVIGANAWICADAFVGPGVTVGEGAVVGARAVAVKDVPAWKVVAGNPAQVIKDRVMKGVKNG